MNPTTTTGIDLKAISARYDYKTNPEGFLQEAADQITKKAGIKTRLDVDVLKKDFTLGNETIPNHTINAAYITNTNKIVMTAALVKKMTPEQATAALAHEIGHFESNTQHKTPAACQDSPHPVAANDTAPSPIQTIPITKQNLMYGLVSLLADAIVDSDFSALGIDNNVLDILNMMAVIDENLPNDAEFYMDASYEQSSTLQNQHDMTHGAANAAQMEEMNADLFGAQHVGPDAMKNSLTAIKSPESESAGPDADHPSIEKRIANIDAHYGA